MRTCRIFFLHLHMKIQFSHKTQLFGYDVSEDVWVKEYAGKEENE